MRQRRLNGWRRARTGHAVPDAVRARSRPSWRRCAGSPIRLYLLGSIVVTNGQYRFLVAEQLAAIGAEAHILLEPARRDSGPAIAAGAGYALTRDDGAVVVALAADHVVTDPVAFTKVCTLARAPAEENRIVMFGVEPTRPATEYGYIRTGPLNGPGLFAIERFVEKRDAETAAPMLI